jgi:acyl-CoA synthetase (AMP-forming)/AMP-acid ligase II
MHPSVHARERPEAAAIIMVSSGETVSWQQLEERSNRGAQLFRSLGLQVGDAIAIWMENNARYLEVCWAAHRAGLYFTPISSHLTAEEAAYIINDSGARVVVTSSGIGGAATTLLADPGKYLQRDPTIFAVGGSMAGAGDWVRARDGMPASRIADETAGQHMVYSSGTTGRPKGIRLPLSGAAADAPLAFTAMLQGQYGVTTDTVYLSPAPLYHTSPLVYCMNIQSVGGTVVILEKFDPEAFMAAVERFQVNSTQMVPTMFVRLLKLSPEIRERFDHSSLRVVIHAAAPCPVPVKHQMIDWWGPILYEFYGGSEANGSTYITSEEWLNKPGSVGRAIWGILHICDDEGNELPAGQPGMVYFEGGMDFQYSNDPEKTKESRNPLHPTWSTLGDVGFLDEDGYLFLTDRKSFMIISGGVNIYPQEIENLLVTHPKVADVAVIGVPHPDFGEEVKAVVQALDPSQAGPELEQELLDFCRERLSSIKCPRSVDFDPQLPRMDNGKLYKKQVRARYWQGRDNTLA